MSASAPPGPTGRKRWRSTAPQSRLRLPAIRTAGPQPVDHLRNGHEQEAAAASGVAPARRARAGDEGAGVLRRVLQYHPAVLRRRPLVLFVPYGDQGTDTSEREKQFLFASQ